MLNQRPEPAVTGLQFTGTVDNPLFQQVVRALKPGNRGVTFPRQNGNGQRGQKQCDEERLQRTDTVDRRLVCKRPTSLHGKNHRAHGNHEHT